MREYRVEKEDNLLRWTDGMIKVELSNSHIQALNEETILTDTSRIMHLYYNIAVYHKFDEEEAQWELMLEKYAYDFPALLTLIEMLNMCLNKGENNLSCKGTFFEDFYEISHYKVSGETRYTLVIGGTPDGVYHSITKSVALEYLTRKDMESFSEFVNSFMADAIEKYNKKLANHEKFNRSNKFIKDNKLYIYERDFSDTPYLDSVLVIGDTLRSLVLFVPNKHGVGFIEEDVDNVVIEAFDAKNNTITCDGEEYLLSDVVYAFMDEPKDKLTYLVDDIVQDYFSIMSPAECAEFKVESVDTLFNKYKWLIICRSWMCRNEHNFEQKYPELLNIKDTGNHERVFEVVKMVIRELKKKC